MLASLSMSLGARDWQTFPVTKVRVTENIILYKTGETAAYPNMVAVNTSKGVVVVDALQYPEVAGRIRNMIEKEFGAPVACLINTRGAFNHTGGNVVFDDVPIYGQANVKREVDMSTLLPGAKISGLTPGGF